MELYQWLIWPINFNEISQVRKAARIWPSDEILIALSKSTMALAAAQPGHLDTGTRAGVGPLWAVQHGLMGRQGVISTFFLLSFR